MTAAEEESGRGLQRWVRQGRHRVPEGASEIRLDRYLAKRFPYRSRAQWAQVVRGGRIRTDGRRARPGQRIRVGVVLDYLPEEVAEPAVARGAPIIHDDEWLLAVDKPADLPLHPSGKYFRNTLLSQLLEQRGETLDAPGIRVVHRLDRETSGVVVFGKTAESTRHLATQFERRESRKSYLALVHGQFPSDLLVEASLGPRSGSRIRKAVGVVPEGMGVSARTEFRLLGAGTGLSLVEARPHTGRQHQIRVHLQHAGYPVVGDKMYGLSEDFFLKLVAGEEYTAEDRLRLRLGRQALHAWKLTLRHPRDDAPISFCASLPADMAGLCQISGIDWRQALDAASSSP